MCRCLSPPILTNIITISGARLNAMSYAVGSDTMVIINYDWKLLKLWNKEIIFQQLTRLTYITTFLCRRSPWFDWEWYAFTVWPGATIIHSNRNLIVPFVDSDLTIAVSCRQPTLLFQAFWKKCLCLGIIWKSSAC